MEMMIHCPSCQARLNVSKSAAGKLVRCPKCKQPFKAPNDDREIVEDTVACWLEISVEEEQARQQQEAAIPDTLDELPDYIAPPELPDMPGELEDPGVPEEDAAEPADASPTITTMRPPVKPAMATSATKVAPPAAAPMKNKPMPAPVHRTSAPLPAAGRMAATAPRARTDEPVDGEVRLRVVETHATGVLIAFDSQLLKRAVFRASLPMACIGCGEHDPDQLTARPLIWTDRLTDHTHGGPYIAGKYEAPVHGHATTHDLVAAIRPIEEMPPPYSNPMPYYVCKRCGPQVQVQAHTVAQGHGLVCEVTIPSATYALEWLGRVNGICGDDYLELETYCARAGGGDEAWNELPDQIRGRIAGWYQPVDGERFILYLKDGDYPKSDAGLGGLVLTDQRLVFAKYHKHGSVLLADEDTRLLAVRHGPFDDLITVREGARTKLVRLRPDDTEQLIQTLEQIDSNVKVERSVE